MNKNSNAYQIIYAAVMVLIVGTVLAFIYMALKPKQDDNVANDKRKQILSAVHITAPSDNDIEATFKKYIVAGYLLNEDGSVADSTQDVAFNVDMKNNIKLEKRDLPLFKCKLDDGSVKYIVPVYGAGLWGPIWGYIAVNDNGTDIYGAYFSHESETPGLGAEISTPQFQDQFNGKKLIKDGDFKPVSVLKKGKPAENGEDHVDAITGGTMTSEGVKKMLADCLMHYETFFKNLQSGTNLMCGTDLECETN